MKRIFVAVALLVLVASLAVSSSLTVNRCYRTLTKEIQKTETLYKNGESTEEQLSSLKKYWKKVEPVLMFFANHSYVEEIGIHINRLISLSTTNDNGAFTAESAELKTRLDYLKDSESLTFESIF